jgi:hypothetical protein
MPQYVTRISLSIVPDQEASELAEAQVKVGLNTDDSDHMNLKNPTGHGESYAVMPPETPNSVSTCYHNARCRVVEVRTLTGVRLLLVSRTIDKQNQIP